MDKDKTEAQVAAEATDFLNAEAGQGYDGMSADQFAPVYLRILHSDSPHIQEGMDGYVPGAKFGDFFNDLTGECYGKSIEVVPLKCDIVWMEFKPNNGGFQGAHVPGSVQVTGDEYKGMYAANGNLIIPYHVFYVLIVGEFELGPAVLSFKKTSIPHAKAWNTRIRSVKLPNGRLAPYYSSVWKLTSTMNKNDKGQTWFTIGVGKTTTVERVRWVNGEEFSVFVKPSRAQIDSNKGASLAALESAAGDSPQLTADAGKDNNEY